MTYTASVLTAAQMNTYVRDNFNETAVAKATTGGQLFVSTGPNALAARLPVSATVQTAEGVNTTSYTDLVTPGPTVTTTTGPAAIVAVSCRMKCDSPTNFAYMSFKVAGPTGTNRAATDLESLHLRAGDNGADAGSNYIGASRISLATGLSPGSNTFTAQYRCSGPFNCTFIDRTLIVIPL